jgi:putative endonuclease|tara:strand:+ start:3226 stop:3624 length:399 start_codon:yes stop_codon:yes gene_type:complete
VQHSLTYPDRPLGKKKRLIGQWGEQCAAIHYHHKGYVTLANNWRHQRAEIDLITHLPGSKCLVLVEVKVRNHQLQDHPAAKARQFRRIAKAGTAYLYMHGLSWEIRIDLALVQNLKGKSHVIVYQGFWEGWG